LSALSYQYNRKITRESLEITEGIGTTRVAVEGSYCTAEDEEEKGIARIVVGVGSPEADHKDCVGKEPRGCMVAVAAAGVDRVKDVGEPGAVDIHSIGFGVESLGIAAAMVAGERRENANMA